MSRSRGAMLWLLVSVVVASVLTLIALPEPLRVLRPFWLALIVIYWTIEAPEHYGLGFPSGHAATAAALAVALTALYPRGRWLFAGFAVLAAAQRIDVTAHYPSDVLAGAAVACAVGGTIFDSRLTGRWFDRMEQAG